MTGALVRDLRVRAESARAEARGIEASGRPPASVLAATLRIDADYFDAAANALEHVEHREVREVRVSSVDALPLPEVE